MARNMMIDEQQRTFEDAKAEWHAQDESLEGATDQVRIDLP
jgi:hypothetical protein